MKSTRFFLLVLFLLPVLLFAQHPPVLVFDSFGDQEIGYSISNDGINWSSEVRVKVQPENDCWAAPGDHSMRTPLGAVEEADGRITIVYTALQKTPKGNFYAVGKCTLAWTGDTGK